MKKISKSVLSLVLAISMFATNLFGLVPMTLVHAEPETVTITLDVNGGNPLDDNEIVVEKGTTFGDFWDDNQANIEITHPNPLKALVGMHDDDDVPITPEYVFSADTTFHCEWGDLDPIGTATITVDGPYIGGVVSYTYNQEFDEDEPNIVPELHWNEEDSFGVGGPVRWVIGICSNLEGHEYDCYENFEGEILENTTYYAYFDVWTEDGYGISDEDIASITVNGAIPLQVMRYSNTVVGVVAAVESQEAPEPEMHTVTFYPQNGGNSFTQDVEHGGHLDQPQHPATPANSPEGVHFLGWYRDEQGTQPFDFGRDTVNNDFNLYAVYGTDPEPGPSGDEFISSNDYIIGEDFIYVGFLTFDSTRIEVLDENNHIAGDQESLVVLDANDQVLKEYDLITFAFNDDSYTFDNGQILYSDDEFDLDSIDVTSNTSNKFLIIRGDYDFNEIDGYFIAFQLDNNAENLHIIKGENINNVGGDMEIDHIPVSHVAPVLNHTVTFHPQNNGQTFTQEVADGEYATVPTPAPTNGDLELVGWFRDEQGTQPFSFNTTAITQNLDLYAVWAQPAAGDEFITSNEYYIEEDFIYVGFKQFNSNNINVVNPDYRLAGDQETLTVLDSNDQVVKEYDMITFAFNDNSYVFDNGEIQYTDDEFDLNSIDVTSNTSNKFLIIRGEYDFDEIDGYFIAFIIDTDHNVLLVEKGENINNEGGSMGLEEIPLVHTSGDSLQYQLSTDTLDFGTVEVGFDGSIQRNVMVTNYGDDDITLTVINSESSPFGLYGDTEILVSAHGTENIPFTLNTESEMFNTAGTYTGTVIVRLANENEGGIEVEGTVVVTNQDLGTHTVTFYPQNGEDNFTSEVEHGQLVQAPTPAPAVPANSPEGTQFLGWYRDEQGTQPFEFETTGIELDINLYAIYGEPGGMGDALVYTVSPEVIDFGTVTVGFTGQIDIPVTIRNLIDEEITVRVISPGDVPYGMLGDTEVTIAANGNETINISIDTTSELLQTAGNYSGRIKVCPADDESVWIEIEASLVVANETPTTYTVTFYPQNGGESFTQQVAAGGHATVPTPAPELPANSPEGTEFLGWFRDEQGTQPFDFSQDTINAALNLYAVYGEAGGMGDALEFTVSTDSIDFEEVQVGFTGQLEIPVTITNLIDEEITVNVVNPANVPFGMYGDTEITIAANGNETINISVDATSELLQTAGTYTGVIKIYPADDDEVWLEVEATLVVTAATPDPETHTVTFHPLNGGQNFTQVVEDGGYATVPTPAPTFGDRELLGWYRDDQGNQAFNFAQDAITGDIDLYAIWSEPQGGNEGTITPSTNEVDFGEVELGFATNPEETVVFTNSSDHTLRMTITLPDDGPFGIVGNLVRDIPAGESETVTFIVDKDNALAQVEAEYESLIDVGISEPGEEIGAGFGIEVSVEIVEQNTQPPTPVTHTVTFYPQNNGESFTQEVQDGGHATVPTPAPTNGDKELTGWFRDEQGTQPFDFEQDTITADLNLYAVWTEQQEDPTPVTHTVTFHPQNNGENFTQEVEDGGHATVPTPAPTNGDKELTGWYRDAQGNQAFDFEQDTITADLDLYAVWAEPQNNNDELTILDGNNQNIESNPTEPLEIRASGAITDFLGIRLDESQEYVSPENYDLSAGSTIVKLKPSYLSTLAAGSHTLTFVFGSGTVAAAFTVNNPTPSTPATTNPSTFDDINNWVNILGISLLGLTGSAVIYKKTKKAKNQ